MIGADLRLAFSSRRGNCVENGNDERRRSGQSATAATIPCL
ncbi:hypothetical protein BN903_117 [Halorubrum sp. AJ67]|nr:hypothetical protein BN903_117 [Halorubrum sp. AJ67]